MKTLGMQDKDQSGSVDAWHGPGKGTLTIDARSPRQQISYDPTDVADINGNAPYPISESIRLGWRGFVVFFWEGDPLVDGSVKCQETVSNYIAGFSLAFGLAAPKTFWSVAGVINDVDDLTGLSDQVDNETAQEMVAIWKSIVGLKNLQNGMVEITLNDGTVKQVANTVMDFKDFIEILKADQNNGTAAPAPTSPAPENKGPQNPPADAKPPGVCYPE